ERRLKLDKADLTLNGLLFELKAEAYNPSGAIRGRANVKSKRISITDLFQLMPSGQLEMLSDFTFDGDFSLEIDLEYDDTAEEPLQYSGTAVVTDMSMSNREIPGKLEFKRALMDFEPDNLRVNIEDGSFDGKPLKGHLVVSNFEKPVVSGELSGKLNLVFAQPFLPPEDKHELSGVMDFATRFSGSISDVRNMQFSGNIAVVDGRYNSRLIPEPVESYSLRIYFDNHLTRVDEFLIKTASGNLGFDGRINNLIPYLLADSAEVRNVVPSVDGALNGQLNIAMLNGFLPLTGNPQLNGLLTLDLNLTGKATDFSNFRPRGRITVSNASFQDSLLPEPIEKFEADLRISPDTIMIDKLSMAFVSSDLSLSGELIDPFPFFLPLEIVDRTKVKKPHFVFDLSAHRFDTDKLFPEVAPGTAINRAALPADSIPPLILPDINGDGTFSIDTLVYSQVEFTSITGKVKIRECKIDCYDVSGKAYTGDIVGRTSINLSSFDNPLYVGEFQASQIEADDFVSRFSEFGGHLFGKIDINGNYEARGWEPDAFLNSLSMTGKMNMKKGKLVTSGSVYSAINSLASKTGQSFEKEQPLKNLTTNIVVKDGRVSADKLSTSLANLGDLELGGSYGFDGSLDYKGSVLLSQAWTDKLLSQGNLAGGLAALFTDKSSPRIRLPLTITGTMDKPSLNIDYSSMTKNLGENLKDNAADLLKGLFKKK
ncbi:MAG: AsmA-like C-terminal region-containing protein, partial [candidate division Zixibacteria bacterium]|nr:AsmA-like C-terminal region-containing protein [candidate division Zixibacteria bacterium]